jgi:multidrug efflux system outer membrane protein
VKQALIYLLTASLAILLMSGCVRLGPDYHRPDIGVDVPDSYQHATSGVVTLQPEDEWWHVFNDPDLDQLVEAVLQNNLDIKKTTARILELRSQFVQARADRFPTVDVEGQGKRQQQPIIGILPGKSFRTRTNLYTLSLAASFEIDLWGRLARAEEAVRADLLQAVENRRTLTQTVVGEAISLYLHMESLERRIQIAQKSIEDYHRSLAVVAFRYERGLTPTLDVKNARRAAAQAEASLPSLRQDLGTAQHQLAVLLGHYPATAPPRSQPDDYFKRLAPVPTGLPSELLLRRPDIRAADASLRALNARIGVAKASRFPSISLTGSFGYASDELDRLITPQSELWNLAAGIVQPLFDAGKLKAGQRAAEARYQQGVAEYAKTVLTAFSEVESALLTRKEQLARRDRMLHVLKEAKAAQEVAEDRYKRGLVDYLNVLEAQQARYQAENNLVLTELAILTNRVTLYRALGGGWDKGSEQAVQDAKCKVQNEK